MRRRCEGERGRWGKGKWRGKGRGNREEKGRETAVGFCNRLSQGAFVFMIHQCLGWW